MKWKLEGSKQRNDSQRTLQNNFLREKAHLNFSNRALEFMHEAFYKQKQITSVIMNYFFMDVQLSSVIEFKHHMPIHVFEI